MITSLTDIDALLVICDAVPPPTESIFPDMSVERRRYITTFDPLTVEALLLELKEARTEVEKLDYELGELNGRRLDD